MVSCYNGRVIYYLFLSVNVAAQTAEGSQMSWRKMDFLIKTKLTKSSQSLQFFFVCRVFVFDEFEVVAPAGRQQITDVAFGFFLSSLVLISEKNWACRTKQVGNKLRFILIDKLHMMRTTQDIKWLSPKINACGVATASAEAKAEEKTMANVQWSLPHTVHSAIMNTL